MNNNTTRTKTHFSDARNFLRSFSILLSCVAVFSASSMDFHLDWSLLIVFILAACIIVFFVLKKYRGVVEESISDVIVDSDW